MRFKRWFSDIKLSPIGRIVSYVFFLKFFLMSILFGHPSGNPNSYHAALSHFESGRLEAFCVPWMPTPKELDILRLVPRLRAEVGRLERRYFEPLQDCPLIEGRVGEWLRMIRRMVGGRFGGERLSYQANDWLMRTMRRELHRINVTAVHAYEDCALWSFEKARALGKICIYDLPIGYYPAWEATQARLVRNSSDWLPPGGLPSSAFVRPQQKVREMELADLVLVPSRFVERTIASFSDKPVALAAYGVDSEFWHPAPQASQERPLRFIYAGQASLRKGIPELLQAWVKADLKDATLELVGVWHLAPERLSALPLNVSYCGPCSAEELRNRYQEAGVFVFPSFFEGFGLVILEAMACGLPVIASDATAGPDLLDESTGRVFPAGDIEQLIDCLRFFSIHRDRLPAMKANARKKAEGCTWANYRQKVSDAVGMLA
ncbi:MAG: glycosyl transferase group 1 [Chthoniobacteraceae bacterium]|nr:glycosyl transferase group 1 [Chthoniobacteraceae bacterium]